MFAWVSVLPGEEVPNHQGDETKPSPLQLNFTSWGLDLGVLAGFRWRWLALAGLGCLWPAWAGVQHESFFLKRIKLDCRSATVAL